MFNRQLLNKDEMPPGGPTEFPIGDPQRPGTGREGDGQGDDDEDPMITYDDDPKEDTPPDEERSPWKGL